MNVKAIATYGSPKWIDMIRLSADKIISTLHLPEDYPFIKVPGMKEVALILFEEDGKCIAYKLDLKKELTKSTGRMKDGELAEIGEIHWPLELYHSGISAFIRMKDSD